MPEEVVYSYYDTAGNYIWYGSLTGIHVIRNCVLAWLKQEADT